MKRKKMEATPESKDFWPIPGVDGEPYPPLVQEALDRVAKETLRRKRAECTHEDLMWIAGGREHRYGDLGYRRACRDCHLVVPCEHPEDGQYRRAVKYISAGRFMEFSDCRCGHTTAKYHEPKKPEEPKLRTPVYGFDYASRPDAMVSRQLKRAVERAQPYDQGALRRSINRTAEERDWERIRQRNLARRALQAKLPQVITDPDRAPDLTWVRTMSGKEQLR